MKLCKTCKHWEAPKSEAYGEVPGVGECHAVVVFWDASEWTNNYENRQLKPQYAGKLAFVQDGSDYRASLHTKPEFGCVQHEENQVP